MLIDLNNYKKDIRTRICIIGSGVGGGTLAKKLSEKNHEFIIVEAGAIRGNSEIIQKDHAGRDFKMKTTTSIQLGGTTNLWHGVLSPLDKIDFQERSWIPHSGWPIDQDDLEPFYKEASSLLGVPGYTNYDVDSLPDELAIKLEELSFNRSYLVNKLFQQHLPPLNFRDVIRDLTKKSDKMHCYYNAAALELIQSDDGEDVKKLVVANKNGRKLDIYADIFICCAGALETPRLLLNSRSVSENGIGNKYGNVGRFLMDHPMGNLCQVKFKRPIKAQIYSDIKYNNIKIKSGLELNEDHQESMKLPNHNFFFRPSFVEGIDNETEKIKLSLLAIKGGGVTASDLFKVLINLNVIRQILVYKLTLNVAYKFADLFFVTEQIPNPDSRVTLSDKKDNFGYPVAKVNWHLVSEDISGMKKWFDLLHSTLISGNDYTFTHSTEDFDWDNILTTAIHHVGTARMSSTERDGVVDSDLKVYGTNNLYISDGSVFTTSGNVNSSLTISALACKLACYIDRIL